MPHRIFATSRVAEDGSIAIVGPVPHSTPPHPETRHHIAQQTKRFALVDGTLERSKIDAWWIACSVEVQVPAPPGTGRRVQRPNSTVVGMSVHCKSGCTARDQLLPMPHQAEACQVFRQARNDARHERRRRPSDAGDEAVPAGRTRTARFHPREWSGEPRFGKQARPSQREPGVSFPGQRMSYGNCIPGSPCARVRWPACCRAPDGAQVATFV